METEVKSAVEFRSAVPKPPPTDTKDDIFIGGRRVGDITTHGEEREGSKFFASIKPSRGGMIISFHGHSDDSKEEAVRLAIAEGRQAADTLLAYIEMLERALGETEAMPAFKAGA